MHPSQVSPNVWIQPFHSQGAVLERVGGKGANLALLSQAGFPVPPGFLVTTDAYRAFLAANQLEEAIQAALGPGGVQDVDELEVLSGRIRALFASGTIPAPIAKDLLETYQDLGCPAVAVRSSATAEDLPEMSFAGQQDTYLNVSGGEALLKAVVSCWSSLWTARAIGYRARNGVPQSGAALAVVVQCMVPSQASGVLFTVNPLTGQRGQVVIDATLGLGEALVSGQVEPDHYVVHAASGAIVSKTLGAKAISIRGLAGGGTETRAEDGRGIQALPDEQILALAQLGQQVAEMYRSPQDIEWAWAGGRLWLLQSRAITSLFPVPAELEGGPLKVLFSFAAVQGMLDPVTPLGGDLLKMIFAQGAALFGIRVNARTQTVLYSAGERLWLNFTPIVTNSTGRSVIKAVIGSLEPSIGQALEQIWDDPLLQPGRPGIRFAARRQLARFFVPLAFNAVLNLLAPERRRQYIVQNGEAVLRKIRTRADAISHDPHLDEPTKLARRARLLSDLYREDMARTLILFVSGVAAGMASFNLVNQLAQASAQTGSHAGAEPDWDNRVLEVTRGLPHNPTTEMDLLLWDTARAIQNDPAGLAAFQEQTPHELARQYLAGQLPPSLQDAARRFLDQYGARGLAEIDAGRERWREDPTHVFEMLNSYLQIQDRERAPDEVFRRGAKTAQAVVADLAGRVRKTRGGWLKARLLRAAARRARALMGVREAPKFFAVRILGVVREGLLESGQELQATGELEQRDDLFFLTTDEIEAFAKQDAFDWKALIRERREAYHRETLRRQIPRLLLSDGRAFYEGMAGSVGGESLQGSPVSPGSVEGPVRVVLDPRQANLQPGEILVCRGTDPSWTPLFLSAGGLVMEVGGMMTHGAVVAREYGIPAVVGVHEATSVLRTGQRVRVDGSSGVIILLKTAGE
jgi:rifampicin phosphotransferase